MDPIASKLLRTVGMRVRRRRLELGLSLKRLAELSALSPRFLSDVEAGKGNIAIVRLDSLARAIDFSLAEIVRPIPMGGARQRLEDLLDGATDTDIQRLVEIMEVVRGQRAPGVLALLGVRGAGKSAVGAALSISLGLPFIEVANQIERQAGMPLIDLFTLYGEPYYRRLEMRCLADLLASGKQCIAALPGGVVTNPDALRMIQESCHSVWLRADPEDYWARVFAQGDTRPTAGRKNAMEELRALTKHRAPLYGQADHIVDTSGKTIEEVVIAVLNSLEKTRSKPLDTEIWRGK